MIRTATTTWGITSSQFLWSYGVLCLGAALGIWQGWRGVLGPKDRGNDPLPDLGLYKLAMLGGGSQLAITSAAAKLHRDGRLTAGPVTSTLAAKGELEPDADRLEREVFETVRQEEYMTPATMRATVAGSEPVRWMRDELTSAGLLLDDSRSSLLRGLWLAGGLLTTLGIARIVAGAANDADVLYLVAMVAAVAVATVWASRRMPLATNRGRELLKRRRTQRDDLRRHPIAGEGALSVALFGAGALWLADPALASSLGVPREERNWGPGNGGGCSMAGSCSSGTGCGSSGGGGGCGGGGCGGGGG